jgi:alpha-1,2-mannosyltransferase
MFLGRHQPMPSDFVSFYAAGKLALSGAPQLAYDQLAHYQAEQQATAAGVIKYVFFFYPPIFLILCAALARLPYWAAFVLFQALSLALYLAVVQRILRRSGWVWCVPVLAFPSVFWVLGLGQNSFLTAALFGLGTLLIDTRPVLAGAAFGLLCYKPHFGLLVPLALAAGRRWTAFVAAAATVAGAVAASICLFGVAPWREYLSAMSGSHAVYESGRINLAGFVTPFGAARLIGVPPAMAYALQIVATLVVAACVVRVWRGGASLSVRSGVLVAGTLLAVPVALFYDLILVTLGIAWLVRLGDEGRFQPWEKLALIGVYVVPLVSLPLGVEWRVPIGPLAAAAVFVLCLARLDPSPDRRGGAPALPE